MSEMDEMREKIAKWLYGSRVFLGLAYDPIHWEDTQEFIRGHFRDGANVFLSLNTNTCRIAVVKKKAELPTRPYGYFGDKMELREYEQTQEQMLEAGFVQKVKDE